MSRTRFVFGPKGSGKSLLGVIEMCRILKNTDMGIVTDIPIVLSLQKARSSHQVKTIADFIFAAKKRLGKKKEVADYWTFQEWAQVFIEKPVMVADRLVYIDEQMASEFYLYLPTFGMKLNLADYPGLSEWNCSDPERLSIGYKLPQRIHPKLGDKVMLADFRFRGMNEEKIVGPFGGRGIYYAMDEVHKKFPVRFYRETSMAVEDYLSESRKLSDQIDLFTQDPGKVDKLLRRNATEWVYVINGGMKRFFMGVRFPGRFRAWVWEQPDLPAAGDKPDYAINYRLDPAKRYHWLYRTMAGSSVSTDLVSESNVSVKGLHWSVWIVALVVLMLVLRYSIPAIENSVSFAVHHGIKAVENGASEGMKGNLQMPSAVQRPSPEHYPAPSPQPAQAIPPVVSPAAGPSDSVFCIGVAAIPPNEVLVYLSDGRIADSALGEVQGVGKYAVEVFNEKFKRKK